jgi:ADP-heptose:LPS heptosyltransferase
LISLLKALTGPAERRTKKLFLSLLDRFLKGEKSSKVSIPRRWASALLIRPDRLGDFVLTLPALLAFKKKAGPRCQTTLVVGERGEALARLFFPDWNLKVYRKKPLTQLGLLAALKSRSYDLTLDFHSFPFSNTTALWTLFSGSRIRIGFFEKRGDHPSAKIYNAGVPICDENVHERDKNWKLLKRLFPGLGAPPVIQAIPPVPGGFAFQADQFWQACEIGPQDKVLGFHPTLGKKDNRWSPEKYLELIRRLSKATRLKFVLVHGWGEDAALDEFRKKAAGIPGLFILPGHDLLLILQAAKRFDGFVCNDSGLMHALSLVTNVAAVFGPSDPERWGPIGGHAHKIFRAPDHLCDSVRVSEVAGYIQKTWAGRKSLRAANRGTI